VGSFADNVDSQVRALAFEFLREQRQLHGDVLPQRILQTGFQFEGRRVPLMNPQGIFKPAVMPTYPLSFRTSPPSMRHPAPYEDELGSDGLIRYRYRGTDPQHRDNVGLRAAMRDGIPLVYLYGVVAGQYYPVWPVFIVGADDRALTFSVAVDEEAVLQRQEWVMGEGGSEAKRRYITVATQHRLHQQSFRERVLRAYVERCAICRLHHPELLEAAHILPDGHPDGLPVIPNGLSLCKLHHAAYDEKLIGIRPDYGIEVRHDLLEEQDGPMLKYGLQGFNGESIHVPRPNDFKPNRDFLDYRYEQFRAAS